MEALLKQPVIPGLTDPLVELPDDDWALTLGALKSARLVTVQRDAAGALTSLDAHPLMREYFAERLEDEDAKTKPDESPFRLAHRRLYEHLCETTEDKPDATLEDLQPLYQAVAHGCRAGLQQAACDEVYFARIVRHGQHYSTKGLGAFGSDLGAVACFFEQPWRRLSPALKETDRAWLLNQAGVLLRFLGRPTEGVEPMRTSLEMRLSRAHWGEAAIAAGNLSQLELTLGAVAAAV